MNDAFSISTIYYPEHLRFFVLDTKEDLGEFATIEELKELMKKGYALISDFYKERSKYFNTLSDLYKERSENVGS